MADHPRSIVVVGAGLAAAEAVRVLREEEAYSGAVTLLGAEAHRPYERPPLSKDYLQGACDRQSAFVHAQSWYDEHDVDLRLGTEAAAINRSASEVLTVDGDRFAYDRLLLCTGAEPRRLDVPGADLPGVHLLRTLEDGDALKEAFARVHRVVIIGAGWIGLETAAAARAAGLDVVVLEGAAQPLLRVLGPQVAPLYADLHRDHGVDLRFGVQVSELVASQGALGGVRVSGSDIVEADLVIVGVGVSPRSQLAARAGLDAPDGITVDEHLRTADPAIFAAGDVANAYHPLLGASVRVEHWANARWQGETAARSMLGHDAVHDRLPYFSSDQYDWGMEYTGHLGSEGYDQVVVRGHDREFVAFWLREGRVLAGMNVNVWDAAEPIGALIRSRAVVTPGRWPIPRCRSRSSLPPADPAQRSLWTPASSWRAITIRCTWLVPS